MTNPLNDQWLAGDAYEAYMGRWSRPLAREFLQWLQRLRGTGPAPTYVASLDPAARDALRDRLRRRLQTSGDERILLRARAWAVRGIVGASADGRPSRSGV